MASVGVMFTRLAGPSTRHCSNFDTNLLLRSKTHTRTDSGRSAVVADNAAIVFHFSRGGALVYSLYPADAPRDSMPVQALQATKSKSGHAPNLLGYTLLAILFLCVLAQAQSRIDCNALEQPDSQVASVLSCYVPAGSSRCQIPASTYPVLYLSARPRNNEHLFNSGGMDPARRAVGSNTRWVSTSSVSANRPGEKLYDQFRRRFAYATTIFFLQEFIMRTSKAPSGQEPREEGITVHGRLWAAFRFHASPIVSAVDTHECGADHETSAA